MTPTHRRGRFSDIVARRLGMERNALRRGSDRIESLIVVTLILIFFVGAPLLGLFVGRATYQSSLRTERAQADPHPVTAQLTADSLSRGRSTDRVSSGEAMAQARWTYAGVTHTGQVRVQPGAKAGTTVTVPVDDTGRPIYQPRSHAETITRGIVLGSVSAICLGFALWTTCLIVRSILINQRLDDWEADWSTFEPKWTGRPGG